MDQENDKRGYLYEDFRLFHLKDSRGTSTPVHYHEFHKLLFLLNGRGEYCLDGKLYPVSSGDILCVSSFTLHYPVFPAGSNYERIIIYLSPQFTDTSPELRAFFTPGEGRILHPSESETADLMRILTDLKQESTGQRTGHLLLSRAKMTELLVALLRHSEAAPAAAADDRISQLMRYLDAHLTEELDADSLAETFFISKYHLMRRFKAASGVTLHAWILRRRLLLARRQLSEGKSPTAVCFDCGFGSYSSFSRDYRREFGISPVQTAGRLPSLRSRHPGTD